MDRGKYKPSELRKTDKQAVEHIAIKWKDTFLSITAQVSPDIVDRATGLVL